LASDEARLVSAEENHGVADVGWQAETPHGCPAALVPVLNPELYAISAAVILRRLSAQNSISPYPAKTIDDLELDDKVYKPDFEITTRFQGFSKELVRISLLGLGVYGFLIKLAADEPGPERRLMHALQGHPVLAAGGVAAFALCSACALIHGFMSNQCLGHQLVISRYFGRLKGDRWDERMKDAFREEIRRQQKEQRVVLIRGNRFLVAATFSLIVGASFVAMCSALVLLNR
jgi:hypothetical protein